MPDDRTKQIQAVLDEPRNGCNSYIRYNPLTPRFIITDGVKELADTAGCYWLLDILATELEPVVTKGIGEGKFASVFVQMWVVGHEARIEASHGDGIPAVWSRFISYTDFPEGSWDLFEIGGDEFDGHQTMSAICALFSEH